MIAVGRGLLSFVKLALLWLLSQLAALWKATGIRNFNLEWSRYGLCMSIECRRNRYHLDLYDWRTFTFRWTDVSKLAEYAYSVQLRFQMPWTCDGRYSRTWRCRRCNNIYYNTSETIPGDGICDACIKAEVIANHNNGRVAEPA